MNHSSSSPSAIRTIQQGPASYERRAFLRRSALLSIAGAAAPWAMQLATMAEASAQTAGGGDDYKALVCVFLYGGNDHANMVIPYDSSGYSLYSARRQAIALPYNSLLPLQARSLGDAFATPRAKPDRQSFDSISKFALAPTAAPMALSGAMPELQLLFNGGSSPYGIVTQSPLAILLNVGTLNHPNTTKGDYIARYDLPRKLFSHNDQFSLWQSSVGEGSAVGTGGRLGDLFLNGNGSGASFTCVNTAGNAVFSSGEQAVQYQVSANGAIKLISESQPTLYGNPALSAALSNIAKNHGGNHGFEVLYRSIIRRSVELESRLTSGISSVTLNTPFNSANSLAMQLKMVARMIGARQALGSPKRQVFFVSLGGFDLHDGINVADLTTPGTVMSDKHRPLLKSVSEALNSFYFATRELGVSDKVMTFTASDFGRTVNSNGNGSDHAWGSHHFLMGDAVKGNLIYGQGQDYNPTSSSTNDIGGGRFIPSTSVEQFGAEFATWMGVSKSDMHLIYPNWGQFKDELAMEMVRTSVRDSVAVSKLPIPSERL